MLSDEQTNIASLSKSEFDGNYFKVVFLCQLHNGGHHH
jgi:hypothetical protein